MEEEEEEEEDIIKRVRALGHQGCKRINKYKYIPSFRPHCSRPAFSLQRGSQ